MEGNKTENTRRCEKLKDANRNFRRGSSEFFKELRRKCKLVHSYVQIENENSSVNVGSSAIIIQNMVKRIGEAENSENGGHCEDIVQYVFDVENAT